MLVRLSTSFLLAAALLAPGCKKADKAPAPSPGSAASPTPAASPKEAPVAVTPPPSDPAATPPTTEEQVPASAGGSATGVVKASVLEKLNVPKPKKLPDKSIWSSAKAVQDGDRLINYVDGDKQYMTLHFLDCNLPIVKSMESKAPADRGEYAFCYDHEVDKVKGFSLFGKGDEIRAVKAGHLMIIATIGVAADPSYGIPDLVEFLGSLDLPALAKL